MSDSNITLWLEQLGLDQYSAAFVENAIDEMVLVELTDSDLKELGVVALGHRKKILKAIGKLAEASGGPLASEDFPADAPTTNLAAWERLPDERKPATILFADITGSTALTEHLDSEDTHDLLDGARQRICAAVGNNRGTVCRVMGDGVMAVFGAPVASENHAVEACHAAYNMQKSIRQYADQLNARGQAGLQIRVGLHSGEIVVLVGGDEGKVEYDADGPTVPVAARMEQIAKPGEVYLTASTYSLAGRRIEAAALDPVSVKGLSEPVKVYTLRGVRSAEEALGDIHSTPFIGRRAEMNQFAGVLETCVTEDQGQTIYVRGEPGIGKSRLIEEFSSGARQRGLPVHRGLVLPFGVAKGQDAVRSIVRSLLGLEVKSTEDDRQRIVDRLIADSRIDSSQAVFLNDLLDLDQPIEQRALYDAMDDATRNQGKMNTVSALLTSACSSQPIVVVVEDVHWADAITLNHLAELTKIAADLPVLIVMTSRIEGDQLDQGWRATVDGSPLTTIDLGPLRPQDAVALISEYVDASNAIAKTCLERAAGNPLFLEQLLHAAREGSEGSLPESIQSLVLARLDGLDPHDKQALQAASVIGQRFDMDTLLQLLNVSSYDIQVLIKHNLVRPDASQYLFAHALIQESIYASLVKRQRKDLHRKVARWYEGSDPVLHAQHLDRAEDEKAPQAYLKAAQFQFAQYRVEQALRLVERGLEIVSLNLDRLELLCFRGELLLDLGRVADSNEAYRQCLGAADNHIQRCRARLGLASCMRITDDLEEALNVLDLAESEAGENAKAELARIHHIRGSLLFPMGDINGCMEQHRMALEYARELDLPELEAMALGGIGDSFYGAGRMRSLLETVSECISVCRRHGLGRIEVAHQPMASGARYFMNEIRTAHEEYLLTGRLAQKVGHTRAEIQAYVGVSITSFDLGYLSEVIRYSERGLALTRELGALRFVPRFLQSQARVALAENRPTDAEDLLEEAIAVSKCTGIGYIGPALYGVLARAVKDPEKRERALRQGETLLEQGCISHNYIEFYQDAMEAFLDTRDWLRVQDYAASLEDYTRNEPLPMTDFIIARGRTLASIGLGNREDHSLRELRRLRDEAERVGLKHALPAIEAAS